MNCRECKYKADQPRTHHIACHHPKVSPCCISCLARLLQGNREDCNKLANLLGITINDHGFKNNWAFFPILYDPIWIEGCTGFETRNKKEDKEV